MIVLVASCVKSILQRVWALTHMSLQGYMYFQNNGCENLSPVCGMGIKLKGGIMFLNAHKKHYNFIWSVVFVNLLIILCCHFACFCRHVSLVSKAKDSGPWWNNHTWQCHCCRMASKEDVEGRDFIIYVLCYLVMYIHINLYIYTISMHNYVSNAHLLSL